MASKSFARTALRATRQKAAAPAVPKRSFISTATSTRPAVQRSARAIVAPTQSRGVKTIDFAGTEEKVFGMPADPARVHV